MRGEELDIYAPASQRTEIEKRSNQTRPSSLTHLEKPDKQQSRAQILFQFSFLYFLLSVFVFLFHFPYFLNLLSFYYNNSYPFLS
jgi:hypothetical protein